MLTVGTLYECLCLTHYVWTGCRGLQANVYRPSTSGKDTSYVGRYVGFLTTMGGKAVALTVTPAHKRWEPDSGLVPASIAISAKVIRGTRVVVLLQAILRPGRSRT